MNDDRLTYYTVYDDRTDKVLAFGTAREAAAMLGVTLHTFYCIVIKAGRGQMKKYAVVAESVASE